MDPGERTTGTRDEHYNLIAVLYHALHGAENCDIYALDAEAGGRVDLSDFFREAQAMQREMADRAKELLGIGGAVPRVGDVPTGDATVVGGDVPPETTPGDVPPMAEDLPPRTADVPSGRVPPSDTAPTAGIPESPSGVAQGAEDIPPRTTDVPPEEPPLDTAPRGDVPPEIPGGVTPDTVPEEVPPRTEDVPPPDAPRTEGVTPAAGDVRPATAPLEHDVPPETAPGEVPPQTTDVQREAQVRAEEVGPPTEEMPQTTHVPPTRPDEEALVQPMGPPTEEVRPSPSEPTPSGEKPPETEGRTGTREYFSNLIRETDRRSRGAT